MGQKINFYFGHVKSEMPPRPPSKGIYKHCIFFLSFMSYLFTNSLYLFFFFFSAPILSYFYNQTT